MTLYGLQKLTLLDYPGHLACTAFTGGCNFCCPFCHNAPLVLSRDTYPPIPQDEFFAFLQKRRGILEGVCITGGEPTLWPDLPEFLAKIKALGFLIKLDTNGYEPNMLERVLTGGYVDMVAMDIKNCPERYAAAAGLSLEHFDISRILASTELLRSCQIPYEFRTTVVKELHKEECFIKIGEWLAGPSPYFLQQFVPENGLVCGDLGRFHAYEDAKLHVFAQLLACYLPNTFVRGSQTAI